MNKNFDQWWDEVGYSALCAKNLESNNIKIGFDHELIVKEISRLAFNENLKPIDMQGAFVIVVERDNDKGSKIKRDAFLTRRTTSGEQHDEHQWNQTALDLAHESDTCCCNSVARSIARSMKAADSGHMSDSRSK